MKTFEFYEIKNLIINKNYYLVFKRNNLLNIQSLENLRNPFYKKKKRYRLIQGFQIENLRIYIKKYFFNIKEGINEWKNIGLLWRKGFATAIPIFLGKTNHSLLIGVEEIKGVSCIKLMKDQPETKEKIINEIALFLGLFHKVGLFHQDCYLNHLYWDEESKILSVLDVSRVVENPLFSLKYQIKDLSQLAFSFETYLEKEAPLWWNYFWGNYINYYGVKNEKILKVLIDIKRWLIRKRTIRKLLKGEKL